MQNLRRVTISQRRQLLAERHRLTPTLGTNDIAKIARSVIALHSSDPVTLYLSAMARMTSPSFAGVDNALYKKRTLVRHHAMRRTLWVVTHDDLEICHAAATRRVAEADRKRTLKLLAKNSDLDAVDTWLAAAETEVLTYLGQTKRASTREIGDALPHLKVPVQIAPGKPYSATASALSRVLTQLGFDGLIARDQPTGGWNTSQYQWTLMGNATTADLDDIATDDARSRLARRWLWAFGPAPLSDLQWWTGWPAGITRNAVESSGAVQVLVESAPDVWEDGWAIDGWAIDGCDEPRPTAPWTALLPGLDPTSMGWKKRDWYLEPSMVPDLFDRNGNGGPTVWVDGQIVGGWTQTPTGKIVYRLLTDVAKERIAEIDLTARRLETLLGDRRFKARFPAPIQSELVNDETG